jgi:hypothetical protein
MGVNSLIAQETGRMETDRPDQTESPVLTKKKYIQTEFGFSVIEENGLRSYVHPTVLWKYGISKRFEFRMITDFVSTESELLIPGGNKMESGLLPIELGGKISLWEEKGFLPKTSFIFHVAPPNLGSEVYHTDKWAPNFRFTMQNTITKNIGLGYNFGAEWLGFSSTPYWIYTLAPGFNIGKDWYGYVEIFGAFRKNEMPKHNLDAGFAYYFTDNLKIDISSGVGISEGSPDWYSAIGFSCRFKVKK